MFNTVNLAVQLLQVLNKLEVLLITVDISVELNKKTHVWRRKVGNSSWIWNQFKF